MIKYFFPSAPCHLTYAKYFQNRLEKEQKGKLLLFQQAHCIRTLLKSKVKQSHGEARFPHSAAALNQQI